MKSTVLKISLLASAVALAACETETVTDTVTVDVPSVVSCTAADATLVAMADAQDLQGNALTIDGELVPVCRVTPGVINSDTTFKADHAYILTGSIQIGNDDKAATQAKDTKLTIEAGTYVLGQGKEALIVSRDGQIFAEGTQAKPIVFTHINELIQGADFDATQRGLWGGLVINGYATTNKGVDLVGEGFSGKYAGTKDDDNSGVLKYVVVKYAGYAFTSENELNGIAFQAVGNGTEVDYIQVHNNSDDGVEFFGGTVNVKHLVLTGNADDSLDWTYGWRGKAQHVYIEQVNGGDKGIEADNNSKNYEALPRSNPTIANVTIISYADTKSQAKAMKTRYGTDAQFFNAAVVSESTCIDFDSGHDVNVKNSVFECAATISFSGDNTTDSAAGDVIDVNSVEEFSAMDSITFTNHQAVVTSIVTPHADLASVDAFFDDADYFGAVGAQDWTAGWTHAWK